MIEENSYDEHGFDPEGEFLHSPHPDLPEDPYPIIPGEDDYAAGLHDAGPDDVRSDAPEKVGSPFDAKLAYRDVLAIGATVIPSDGTQKRPPQTRFSLPADSLSRYANLPRESSGANDSNYKYARSFSDEEALAGPRLLVHVRDDPQFVELHDVHQREAARAETVLNLGAVHGYIDLAKAQRIIDFGAGRGGPTFALKQLVSQNSGILEVIESRGPCVEDMVNRGIVSAEHAHVGDGIAFLASDAAANQYDMVTSFMFGPDLEGSFAKDLLIASHNALRPEGRLILTSDFGTMATVRSVCEQIGLPYEYIDGIPIEADMLPDTIIVSFPEK